MPKEGRKSVKTRGKCQKNYEVKANTAKDSQIADAWAKDGKRR